MKVAVKLIGIGIVLIVCTVLIVTSVQSKPTSYQQTNARIRVCVVDLDGKAVHNAKVRIIGSSLQFFTDNNGFSPLMDLPKRNNVYDKNVTQWYTINLQISKAGLVDTFVLNCVVYQGGERSVTVRVYPADQSDLPYVCYVESPPNDYLESLIGQK